MIDNQTTVLESTDLSSEEMARVLSEMEAAETAVSLEALDVASIPADAVALSEGARAAMDKFIDSLGTVSQEPEETEQKPEEKEPEPMQVIVPNSPSLLVEESSSRFSSAVWYNAVRSKKIILAGVGGIGSYVAFLLSRMKPQTILMYDPDIVEEANMSGQLYSKKDIGNAKVDSMSAMMADYSGYYNTMCINSRYEAGSTTDDIMICGFDNMAARRTFFISWLQHVQSLSVEDRKKCLFIDGRLAAEEFQVFCITGDDVYHQQKYNHEYLFSDREADETICSYKQTSHCANMIGSVMVNLFVNFVANECDPLIPRDLPFLTSYDAERMYFKTEII